MTVLIIPACFAGTDNKSTVRDPAVITFQFFFCDEVYCSIVLIEVVRHSLDLVLDTCKVCAFLSYYEALSGVFLSCCKFRIFSVSYSFQCCFYRDGVLFAVFDSVDPADRIGMSLAYTLAPECIIFTVGKDCICIQSVQGEHSRVPAHGDDSYMAALGSCLVYVCKMLRNSCMSVKAVYDIEPLCIFRCLLRKVCCTSSAEDQNIDLVFHFFCFIYMINACCICEDFYC